MYALVVYVPEAALEKVKTALFSAGAGRIGSYDQCCWQVKGEGQFRPLPGSSPAIGSTGIVERVPEWKIELVCEASRLPWALEAMRKAHPYETPAYQVLRMEPGP